MKKTLQLSLLSLGLSITSSATAAIVLTDGVAYTQDFNTLATTSLSTILPNGWTFVEIGTGATNTSYAADTGSGTTGNTYSYGSTGSTDRALGGLDSGTLASTLGASFTLPGPLSDVVIAYTGEQWRLGAAGREDRLDFSYSTDATSLTTGTWTPMITLNFVTPATAAPNGQKDGNLAANRTALGPVTLESVASDTSTLWIRWTPIDANGADDGLAIDDFSLTASVVPEPSSLMLGLLSGLALLGRRRR